MSRNSKIALGIIGGALASCCLCGVIAYLLVFPRLGELVSQSFVEDPAESAAVGQSILDYDLPPGFREEAAVNMLGTKMVIIAGEGEMVIMLMQLPSAVSGNEAEMQAQLEQAFASRSEFADAEMQLVTSEEININGRATTLNISEGTDDTGQRLRQMTAVFQGPDGTGMLMIFGAAEGWNETAVEQFLRSIE